MSEAFRREEVTIDQVYDLLCEINALDRDACRGLVLARVPCKNQVWEAGFPVSVSSTNSFFETGLISAVNGIFRSSQPSKMSWCIGSKFNLRCEYCAYEETQEDAQDNYLDEDSICPMCRQGKMLYDGALEFVKISFGEGNHGPAISINHVVEWLNLLNDIDPEACTALFERRVPCNYALARHPTIQVDCVGFNVPAAHKYLVGLLGVLNGMFGVDDKLWGAIQMLQTLRCDYCIAEDVPEMEGLVLENKCPFCDEGILRVGRILEFQNRWKDQDAKQAV